MKKALKILAFAALGVASLGGATAWAVNKPSEAEAASATPALTPGNFVYLYMNATTTAWYNNAAYDYYFTFRDSTNANVVRSAPAATTYPGAVNLPLFVAQAPTVSGVSIWYSVQGEVYLKGQDPNIVDPLVYTTLMTDVTYNLFDCAAASPFAAYEDSDDATQHAKYLAGVPLTQRAWTNGWPNKPYASIFADNFLRQTQTACSASDAQTLLDSAWAGFASDYAALNATAKGFIKSATALTTPDTTTFDNLMNSCAGRYDFIMHRYVSDTTLNDFMARGSKKAYESPLTASESDSSIFVASIGILALGSVGAYFFVRAKKRKAE